MNPSFPKVVRIKEIKKDRDRKRRLNPKYREYQNSYKKRRRLNDPEFRERCNERARKRIRRLKEGFPVEYRKHYCESHRKWRRKLRIQVIDFLGEKCNRCGFEDWRALQIDHVNGEGRRKRSLDGNQCRRLYKRVKESPKEYQILCANCNWIKRYENYEWWRGDDQ